MYVLLFFFNDTATTEIYTLSLHDALPICRLVDPPEWRPSAPCKLLGTAWLCPAFDCRLALAIERGVLSDRKSTRLNSSHANISYAVFCLKKKKLLNL